jgi:translation initiation factor IF-2
MPKRIFEVAKDFDIGALDLVEKLKSHGLNVRNHMTILSDDELAKVQAIMDGGSGSASSGHGKKKVVKKKSVATTSTTAQSSELQARKKVVAPKKKEEIVEKDENPRKIVTVKRKVAISKDESELKLKWKLLLLKIKRCKKRVIQEQVIIDGWI